MLDKVRCPACRGAKKVPKLGGMVGECNTCTGVGSIPKSEKVETLISTPMPAVDSLIESVAKCVPVACTDSVVNDVKIDVSKAVFKRKYSRKTVK